MADAYASEAPETLEGWYVLHDVYGMDWARWQAASAGRRDQIAADARQWLEAAAGSTKGDSAAYSVITQKGDLMFVHYRQTPDELNRLELELRQRPLFEYLRPAHSFLSVIEMGQYELTTIVRNSLADQGVQPGADEYEEYFDTEMKKQRRRAEARLFRRIPEHRYICFYTMNKRRGEQHNWYALPMDDRRELMRGHGRVGHKYRGQVTQVIGGAIGLDDWEWGVSLHANDALLFKKLVYEMRFDAASALYADFGPFFVGIRVPPERFPALLAGLLPETSGKACCDVPEE